VSRQRILQMEKEEGERGKDEKCVRRKMLRREKG
jgi:hypothetical protein